MADKWVPEKIGGIPVCRIEAIPPECRVKGDGPIILDCTLLTVYLVNGKIRHYGVKDALIDSYLRMRVKLLDPKFEEMAKWPDAKK